MTDYSKNTKEELLANIASINKSLLIAEARVEMLTKWKHEIAVELERRV